MSSSASSTLSNLSMGNSLCGEARDNRFDGISSGSPSRDAYHLDSSGVVRIPRKIQRQIEKMTPKTHLCAETLKSLEKPDPEKEVKDWIAKLEIYPEDLNVKETTEPLKREREEFIYLDFWLYHPMFDTRSGPRPQFVVGPPQEEKKLN